MSSQARSSGDRSARARSSIASASTRAGPRRSRRARSAAIAGISDGSFIDSRIWPKKRCLVDRRSTSAPRLRAAVIGGTAEAVGDARQCEERGLQIAVNDRLSRGGDNAQERGVGPQCWRLTPRPSHYFTGCRATPSDWHLASTKVARCSPTAHPPVQGLSLGLQIGLCVVVGRIEADVSQPTADDGDVDPAATR
jgi:hypothetical protein